MADFYSILTDAGKTKLTAALTNKKPLFFAKMAAGDGAGAQYTVTSALTKLKNEKWRGDIRDVRLSEASEYQAVVEAIIPVEVGNFWIREIGLFDDAGTLIAIANYPDTFKPPLQSGVGKQIIIQLLITVQDQAAVTLIVSDNVNYATKAELNGFLKTSNNLSEIKTAGTAAQQAARTNLAIPDGTTAVKGMVQLYNNVDSASTVYAATAAAVKTAYDKANAAQIAASGSLKSYAQGAEPTSNQGDIYIIGIGVCAWDATAPAGYKKKYFDSIETLRTSKTIAFGKYVRRVKVSLRGGGGGGAGGGSNRRSGGGGSGGTAYADLSIPASSSILVTVGAGGSGGAGGGATSKSGSSGGVSSFGSYLSCGGGGGGGGVSDALPKGTGGVGGTAGTGGDKGSNGNDGTDGIGGIGTLGVGGSGGNGSLASAKGIDGQAGYAIIEY